MVIKYNTKNKDGKNYIYYTCSSKNKSFSKPKCDTPNLRAELVDSQLIRKIKTYNKDVILNVYNSKLNILLNSSNKNLLTL